MKNKFLSVLNVLVLCFIIFVVSVRFVYSQRLIGLVLIGLAVACLWSLKLFRVQVSSAKPDIIFGVIDNGVLAIMAIFGAEIAGVAGAIIGGVVGNAMTDGIAGLFEGYWAEGLKSDKRTILGSAVGKMAGCLFGAGGVLLIAQLLSPL